MDEPSMRMRRQLAAWGVTSTGAAVSTPTSELMPGIRAGIPVMLKIARVEEEVRGSALLQWWGGRGAAAVLEREGDAVLMVRATGTRDLAAMTASGRDAAATEILVRTSTALHDRPAPTALDEESGPLLLVPGVPELAKMGQSLALIPLRDWFHGLLSDSDSAASADPLLRRAAEVAERLLAGTDPADVVVLHGDIHHGNVLDFGDHWAVIDPKGLIGHRAFDVANIFCNPTEAGALENLPARLDTVSRLIDIPQPVLAEWVIAWCGLSLAWEADQDTPSWHARTARVVAEQLLEQPRSTHPAPSRSKAEQAPTIGW